MKNRTLGVASPFEVSEMGFGCMGMSHAYGAPADDAHAKEILYAAMDAGYTFFDTAQAYGYAGRPHHNEQLIGEILSPMRNRIQLATKGGLMLDFSGGKVPYPFILDSSRETLRKEVEGSLRRLKTDHIDLYYIHRLDGKTPVEEIARTMSELISEGKILHWGLSEAPAGEIRKAHAVCPLTAIQNRFSMMARWHESLFPMLEELGIGFVAFSPLANGLLSDAYKPTDTFNSANDNRSLMAQFKPEAYEQNRRLMMVLNSIANNHGATPAQVSLAWVLAQKPWIVPIPGSTKAARIKENAGAASVALTHTELDEINRLLAEGSVSAVYGGMSFDKTAKK